MIFELVFFYFFVMYVFVEDGDLGENGRVYYILLGGDSDKFMIDYNIGLIIIIKYLDYEIKFRLEFEVRFFDVVVVGRKMVSVKVFVDIEDVNDNVLVFDKFFYFEEIYEDLIFGIWLLILIVND